MFATTTQIDPALALAIGDAAGCDWQIPSGLSCGDRAVWIAVMSCGCRHLCCGPHREAADRETEQARQAVLQCMLRGVPAFAICIGCHRPIFDYTIVWEPI